MLADAGPVRRAAPRGDVLTGRRGARVWTTSLPSGRSTGAQVRRAARRPRLRDLHLGLDRARPRASWSPHRGLANLASRSVPSWLAAPGDRCCSSTSFELRRLGVRTVAVVLAAGGTLVVATPASVRSRELLSTAGRDRRRCRRGECRAVVAGRRLATRPSAAGAAHGRVRRRGTAGSAGCCLVRERGRRVVNTVRPDRGHRHGVLPRRGHRL